jgi:hypothetical protein
MHLLRHNAPVSQQRRDGGDDKAGGGCETPGARGKQSPGHSATAVSSRRAARSGAGWRGLPVRQRQPAGRQDDVAVR